MLSMRKLLEAADRALVATIESKLEKQPHAQ